MIDVILLFEKIFIKKIVSVMGRKTAKLVVKQSILSHSLDISSFVMINAILLFETIFIKMHNQKLSSDCVFLRTHVYIL